MKEFFNNLWTKESFFRAILVALGGAVATGQVTWMPESIGVLILAIGTMISSGDKNPTVMKR